MKKVVLFTLGLVLASGIVVGQSDEDYDNMVVNPGFEDVDGKLRKLGQIEVAQSWFSGTAASADLFSGKAKSEAIGVPNNQYGRQRTDDGVHYAGIVAYAYQNKMPRTYITTQLNTPMKDGAMYCVKYDVCLSDLSKYAIDNLGSHFSKKKVALDTETDLAFEPVVTSGKNPVIKDMDIWFTVCNYYQAGGGEKYMTIGNFEDNEATEEEKQKRPRGITGSQAAVAYYYIDNVRVYPIDGADECECEKKNGNVASTIYSSQVISETELTPVEIIDYANIYFDYIKDKIESSGVRDLDVIARVMKNNPEFKLTVESHIDKREGEYAKKTGFYKDLAQKRADKVIDYLVEKGISRDRFTIELAEDKKPVDSTGTELGKAKNRRIEFILQ